MENKNKHPEGYKPLQEFQHMFEKSGPLSYKAFLEKHEEKQLKDYPGDLIMEAKYQEQSDGKSDFTNVIDGISYDQFIGEMAKVDYHWGEQKGTRIKDVWVRQGREGPVPHIHVHLKGKIEKIAYVCLHDNIYAWWHYGSGKDGVTLNEPLQKELYSYLNNVQKGSTPDGRPINYNNWQECVQIWLNTFGDRNNHFKRNEQGQIIMPDYRTLYFPK